MDTTTSRRASTRPNHPYPISKHRADFAREAAIDVFGPRAVQALDHNHFKDRQPGQAPRLLEQITVKVARDTGQPDRGLRDD